MEYIPCIIQYTVQCTGVDGGVYTVYYSIHSTGVDSGFYTFINDTLCLLDLLFKSAHMYTVHCSLYRKSFMWKIITE